MEKRPAKVRRLSAITTAIIGLVIISVAPASKLVYTQKAIPRYAIEAACKDNSSQNKLMCGYQAEANLLAITIATECRPHDVLCAGLVYETARTRRVMAEDRVNRVITLGEILTTPKQFSGLDVRYKARKLANIMSGWVDFAQTAIAGKIKIEYPPMTHYARAEVIFKAAWGKDAVRRGCNLYEFPDGHVAVGQCGDSYLPFRLP